MTFFESLIALLLLAVVLLQVSRRTSIPYPTMLATAGVVVALIPGAPAIGLDGHTALALFIAPVLLNAAYDFPLAAIRKLWRPLLALAVFAVLLTTGVVAWIGVADAGLPIAAAIALGAIVAPPDAAAATTVLQSASLPRRTVQVLTGESLLNDASALLLFAGAVAIQSHGGLDPGVALNLGIAVPGGIALGFACAWVSRYTFPLTRGSFGGNLLEFVSTYVAWLLAERLGLSAVLCVVTMAMVIANSHWGQADARNRIQSFAVWGVAVFVLNVIAFLVMGMQARQIVGAMEPGRLREAAEFAAIVVVAVIATRIAWVLLYNAVAARVPALRGDAKPVGFARGLIVGWSGMRGLVTLATAFALPEDFPQRDLITLSAFAVVLATLVLQGLTLSPLIALLGLKGNGEDEREIAAARLALADAALASVADAPGQIGAEIRREFELNRAGLYQGKDRPDYDARLDLKVAAIQAQRDSLRELRDRDEIGETGYELLEQELDWHDLAVAHHGRGPIEEG